jgi:NADH-quinone oxidoreductase subunit F
MLQPFNIDERLQTFLDTKTEKKQTYLLPSLIKTQEIYNHIPKEVAAFIGQYLNVPLADVMGVIEFYSMLSATETGNVIIRVCNSSACTLKGSHEIYKKFEQYAEPGKLFVEEVPCLGMCDSAPVGLIGNHPAKNIQFDEIKPYVNGELIEKTSFIGGNKRPLTFRCRKIEPTNITQYRSLKGFEGLARALKFSPQDLIDEIKKANLLGRGGAAFPAAIKWQGVADQSAKEKYLVCNADESEPGTFKDRTLLEGDPFAILEGMIIAGYAIGASKGYLYVRGEYPRAQSILQKAIEVAKVNNILGENILESEFSFDIEIRSGAGAYICGEETALFESIEGKRGFPRIKPPFPTTHGLFQKPTVINNVETFSNVPLIFRIGADDYRKYGTTDSSGPRLFCLSGDVVNPGVYEVTQKTTLRELIYDIAGGLPENESLQTVLLGGAAGSFVIESQLDTPLTFEDTRAANLSLGSGVVMVFNSSRKIKQTLSELGEFFAHESCGKCFPCQLGTQHQLTILERIHQQKTLPDDLIRLQDIGLTMTEASLCGLGQSAATAVLSAMKHWPELFQEAQ